MRRGVLLAITLGMRSAFLQALEWELGKRSTHCIIHGFIALCGYHRNLGH